MIKSSPIKKLIQQLKACASPKKAKVLSWFFKTKPGQYGHGDIFMGVMVPDIRKIAKQNYCQVSVQQAFQFLKSKIHEQRLLALMILLLRYQRNPRERSTIFNAYLKSIQYINNWDLVDLTAPHIIGDYLLNKKRNILVKSAGSSLLWERRVAIIATFAFIRNGQFDDTLVIVKKLLNDEHDLIHKACGWMLREIGKRNIKILEKFLAKNYKQMPRVMLRYAIERFPESRRKQYLAGRV